MSKIEDRRFYNMFEELRYCSKCIMPETVEGQKFNKDGLCITCQAQKQKESIDWNKRGIELEKILEKAKKSSKGKYDCIVPISGGKDSAYQLYMIKMIYKMNPLAVTFSHNWFTKTGWKNLWNLLEKTQTDHIMFTPNRALVNRMARRSVETIGDACWHCHAGVAAFTLSIAVKFKISTIIWGESTAEYGHRGATFKKADKFDKEYFQRNSAKLTPKEFACKYITEEELAPFQLPTDEECKDVNGIHLGDYINWHTESQVDFVKKTLGWQGREVGGSYKDYKSVECSKAPIHDFLCYLKRGYGRTSIQASQDIRDEGPFTREEAFKLAETYERIEPKILHEFLMSIDMAPIELRECIEKLKHPKIKNIKLPAEKEWRECKEDGESYAEKLINEE